MKKSFNSLGHALRGLSHAIREERNLRAFILGHTALLLLGIILRIDILSLFLATFIAGLFITVELLNTAIERLADTIDDCEKKRNGGHYHLGIKQTKDVASAAALIMLVVYISSIILIAVPYILYIFFQS